MLPSRCCLLVALAASMLLSGCASWSPPITTKDLPTGAEAYVYGRFKIDAPKSWLGFDGNQTMGFVFSCSDGDKYTIRFSIDNPVEVIRIDPATCSMTEIIYTNGDGQILRRKAAPRDSMQNLVLVSGNAYYLGDFYASSQNAAHFGGTTMSWRINNARDDFKGTTAEMKSRFPNMVAIATTDRSFGR